ncbi:MAG TPA: ankyrin repeat domain-containing protein [Alphaproteobacteria bacterium]|nr:ankyrin repeat domain-containing protein [Alphaproteobacteria bacterium]
MSPSMPPLSRDEQRIVNDEMFTALEANDFAERMTLCFKKGADINARNGDGQTALMRAVWQESTARVRFLLRYQPNLLLKDNSNRTVFDLNKQTRSASARADITQMLLNAMPDRAANPAAVPLVEEAAPDVPPAPLRKKGKGPGGFRL